MIYRHCAECGIYTNEYVYNSLKCNKCRNLQICFKCKRIQPLQNFMKMFGYKYNSTCHKCRENNQDKCCRVFEWGCNAEQCNGTHCIGFHNFHYERNKWEEKWRKATLKKCLNCFMIFNRIIRSGDILPPELMGICFRYYKKNEY